jgi:RhoGEF domain/SOS1/NGEF-like PH domain
LETLELAFRVPLRKLELIAQEDMQLFFGEISSLAPLSQKLLFELESRVGISQDKDSNRRKSHLLGAASLADGISSDLDVLAGSGQIGDVFERAAEFLKLYTIYCANQPGALARLGELCRTKPDFNKFLMDTVEHNATVRGLSLNAFLIKPVQRICKYPMLLDTLLKHTSESHVDFVPLQRAREKVNAVVSVVNEKKRTFESQQKTLEVQAMVPGVRGLIQPDRLYVRDGPVICSLSKRDKTPCHVFLFNDLVLVTVKQSTRKLTMVLADLTGKGRGEKFSLKVRIELPKSRLISVADPDGAKHYGFQLASTEGNNTQPIAFLFDTPALRDEWFDAIHSVVRQNQHNTLGRMSSPGVYLVDD